MMYKPMLNTVLVEIDSETDKWGKGNDDSMLGQAYREGTVIRVGTTMSTATMPLSESATYTVADRIAELVDKRIMWNEGVEAGTVFEHDGKMYGFIYWNDIRGVADESA